LCLIDAEFKGAGLDYLFRPSGQTSGHYWPESTRRSKKMIKNGLFFEVFGLFNILSYMIST
jgi:hypothetical protein